MDYPVPEDCAPMPDNEEDNCFLGNQLNAIIRARLLLKQNFPDQKYSLRQTLEHLALAEVRAKYNCGFILLSRYEPTIDFLMAYMERERYATFDTEGNMYLTNKGIETRTEGLPEEIERVFIV